MPRILVCPDSDTYNRELSSSQANSSVLLVDPGEDAGGVIGDLFGAVLYLKQTKAKPPKGSWLDKERCERPVCWLPQGADRASHGFELAEACRFSGIPLIVTQGDKPTRRFPERPHSSTIRWAFRASLDKPGAEDIRARGFTTLIKQGKTPQSCQTNLLLRLLGDNDFLLRPDHESACADLLERKGYPLAAAELRRLIAWWLQQRIWHYKNYVPEMVLHDDVHSAAVDRNVASFCEPFLAPAAAPESAPLSAEDVFALAVTAWLHDIGHASMTYGPAGEPRRASNAFDVREFHGIFSADRLLSPKIDDRSLHGLDDIAKTLHYPQLLGKVAALSAHHQGWTSCDAQGVQNKPDLFDDTLLRPDYSDRADTFLENGPFISSFDTDAIQMAHLADATDEDKQAHIEALHRLLAIIRLADAMDVGLHRAPNTTTQDAIRTDLFDEFLNQLSAVSLDETTVKGLKAVIDEVKMAFHATGGEQKVTPQSLVEHINPRIKAMRERAPREHQSEIKKVGKYAPYLLKQVYYYAEQERIAMLSPVPVEPSADSKGGPTYALCIYVVPNTAKNSNEPDEVEELAQSLALREWGVEHVRQGKAEAADSKKGAILTYLTEGLGFRLDAESLPVELIDPSVMCWVRLESKQPPSRKASKPTPISAIPNGFGEWTVFDGSEYSPHIEVAGASIATDLARSALAALSEDGKLHTRPVHGGPSTAEELPGLTSPAQCLGYCQQDETHFALVHEKNSTGLTLYARNSSGGAWERAPDALFKRNGPSALRAFPVPGPSDADRDRWVCLTKDGRLKHFSPTLKGADFAPGGEGWEAPYIDFDVVEHQGSVWWAAITKKGRIVVLSTQMNEAPPATQREQPGKPKIEKGVKAEALWWAPTPVGGLTLVVQFADGTRAFALANDGTWRDN
ncbi:MAG: HD domain-containing protein [Bifidobacteriaceae bacterium]|nr:HD domain-containing protein [Bifidobacteriaceae bacterium]